MATNNAGTPPAAVRNRKKVDALSADELTALRSGYSTMYGIDDDRGFARYAGIHGLPLPIYCHHHDPLTGGRQLMVTLVPVVTSASGAKRDEDVDVMGLHHVSLVTYD